MSLRANPIRETATLPDGREVRIDVGVVRDDYIADSTETVGVELHAGDAVLASLNTVLEPEQDSEARALAREIRAGLESGDLEPTAGSIEELADRPR
jgi:methionine aminopeptidase